MQRRIARIGSFMPALAAVVASMALSLLILQAPPEESLPGPSPADRGHVGALVLPGAARVSRSSGRASPVPAAATLFAPRRPSAPVAFPVRHSPSAHVAAPAPAPAPQQAARAPSTSPVTPASSPAAPAPQLAILVRRGHGPAPKSNSRLLTSRKERGHHGHPRRIGRPPTGEAAAVAPPLHGQAGCHGRACAAGAVSPAKHGGQGAPRHVGQGKPKAAPTAAIPLQPAEPPGHAAARPAKAGGPPGQGGETRSAHH
jgi:hypothetical protein